MPLTLEFVFFWWISTSFRNSFLKKFSEILTPDFFTSAWSHWNFYFFAHYKPCWTNYCLVGSLGMSQWEVSHIFTIFLSCDAGKGHHSKARSIESIVRFQRLFVKLTIIICIKMSSSEEFFDTNSEEYLSFRESSHIPTTQACTMSFYYITLHIWTHLAEWGLMWTIGENIVKTAFTFSACKKNRIHYCLKFFSGMSSWEMWRSAKGKQIQGLGVL